MKAYLTINQGDTLLGTLRLTLFPHIVPKTVDNFVHYLQSSNDNKEGYRNSTFHRIIPKFMAQGGDFMKGDGTGPYGRWPNICFEECKSYTFTTQVGCIKQVLSKYFASGEFTYVTWPCIEVFRIGYYA